MTFKVYNLLMLRLPNGECAVHEKHERHEKMGGVFGIEMGLGVPGTSNAI